MRRRVEEEIVGQDRGTSENETPDDGIRDRFSALFTYPIDVRESLDRLEELDICR